MKNRWGKTKETIEQSESDEVVECREGSLDDCGEMARNMIMKRANTKTWGGK